MIKSRGMGRALPLKHKKKLKKVIKGLKKANQDNKIHIQESSYLAQNIGVKITSKVKISSLPSNIAKANIPFEYELMLE